MELILDLLSLLNEDVHHHINFLPDVVGLLFEELEHVVASHELVLKYFNLLIYGRAHIINFTSGKLRGVLASLCLTNFVLVEHISLTWESRVAENCNSWALIIMHYSVQTVSFKFVDLWATIDFLLFKWAML